MAVSNGAYNVALELQEGDKVETYAEGKSGNECDIANYQFNGFLVM